MLVNIIPLYWWALYCGSCHHSINEDSPDSIFSVIKYLSSWLQFLVEWALFTTYCCNANAPPGCAFEPLNHRGLAFCCSRYELARSHPLSPLTMQLSHWTSRISRGWRTLPPFLRSDPGNEANQQPLCICIVQPSHATSSQSWCNSH